MSSQILRAADRRVDLGRRADDAGVGQQPRAVGSSPKRATTSGSKPAKAARKASRFLRMVIQASPAWKPSSTSFSHSARGVALGHAPLGVVVGLVERIAGHAAPGASGRRLRSSWRNVLDHRIGGKLSRHGEAAMNASVRIWLRGAGRPRHAVAPDRSPGGQGAGPSQPGDDGWSSPSGPRAPCWSIASAADGASTIVPSGEAVHLRSSWRCRDRREHDC